MSFVWPEFEKSDVLFFCSVFYASHTLQAPTPHTHPSTGFSGLYEYTWANLEKHSLEARKTSKINRIQNAQKIYILSDRSPDILINRFSYQFASLEYSTPEQRSPNVVQMSMTFGQRCVDVVSASRVHWAGYWFRKQTLSVTGFYGLELSPLVIWC